MRLVSSGRSVVSGVVSVSLVLSISGAQTSVSPEAKASTSGDYYPVVVPMVSINGKDSKKLPAAFKIGDWQCYARSDYKIFHEGFGDIPYLDLGVVCASGNNKQMTVSVSRSCWLSKDDFGWVKNVSSSTAKLEGVSVSLLCYEDKKAVK